MQYSVGRSGARRPTPAAEESPLEVVRHPVTVRLRPGVVRLLRRAAAERSIGYIEPHTQQAIVETALEHWLRSAGYGHGAECASHQ